ncbi:DUF6247 family protein [Streptomyces sp. NPDC051561]|uniref:DUF6247 family protein n=1 Tax=Streptomyces sp. NPDC051561 TaxID=3365658 RepID=UPI0037A3CA46
MDALHDSPYDTPRELLPRPERTVTALRDALAALAPSRVAEMDRERDGALSTAMRQGSLDPVQAFLLRWAVMIEIERFPELAGRFHHAERLAQSSEDPATSRRHLRESGDILRTAYRELGAQDAEQTSPVLREWNGYDLTATEQADLDAELNHHLG